MWLTKWLTEAQRKHIRHFFQTNSIKSKTRCKLSQSWSGYSIRLISTTRINPQHDAKYLEEPHHFQGNWISVTKSISAMKPRISNQRPTTLIHRQIPSLFIQSGRVPNTSIGTLDTTTNRWYRTRQL